MLEREFAALEQQGVAALRQEGVSAEHILLERSVDLRYRGQSTALTLAWENSRNAATAFHASP